MIQLRPYQERAVGAINRSWAQGNRGVLACLPTGSGKTVIASRLIGQRDTGRVLFLVPWRELAHQAMKRLADQHVEAGLLLDHRKPTPGQRVTVSTVSTATRRTLADYDLIVLDEAHRSLARSCMALVARYPRARLLGLTATPRRLDGQALSKVFNALVIGATTRELIDAGAISSWRVWGPERPIDVSAVPIDRRTRDYREAELHRAVSGPRLMAEALDEYRQHRGSRLAAVYCVNICHARQVHEAYTAAGVRSALITGDTCDRDRHQAFEALQSRRLEVLVNCAVLTEGIDLPQLDLIQCLRPTLSLCLWRQMLGRGSRRASGKLDCLVLDHADNTRRHGLPDSEPAWSLDGRNPNLRAMREHHDITRCPRCGRLYGPGVHHCVECGSALPVVLEGRLVELSETSIFA